MRRTQPGSSQSMAAAIPRREEKIKNAICFFASEHEGRTGTLLTHTSLYKYLAFLDYATIETTGRPALGLLYLARMRHPLPIGIYAKLQRSRKERFIFLSRGQGRYLVKATEEPDLSFFSPSEVSEMKGLVETYAHRFAKARDASEAKGFRKRRWMRTGESVSYDDVFDDGFITKYKEAYTMAGLHALIEKYVNQIKEFETRMADTKRKLEVVTEAARLLAEEGLSDEQDASNKERTW
jgi:hypothetical protein